jgi:hypothetical protein
MISERVDANSRQLWDYVHGMGSTLARGGGGGADTAHRDMQMMSALHGRIMEQGLVMAYADALFIFGVALLLCTGTVLLLRRPEPNAAVSMAH